MILFKNKPKTSIIILGFILALLIVFFIIPFCRHSVKNLSLTILDTLQTRVPVLMYHHLLREDENKYYKTNYAVISVESFEKQMAVLHDNGYRTITAETLYKFINGEIDLPKKTVLITFDDGYESNYTYAYPILKKYGFKATEFLIGSVVLDKTEAFDPDKLQFMSKQSIAASSSVFEFGSHSYALHNLGDDKKSLLLQTPLNQVEDDIKKSKAYITTPAFAYPYGEHDEDTIAILKRQGFKMAFNSNPGRVTKGINPFEIPRYIIYPNTTLNAFKNYIGMYN